LFEQTIPSVLERASGELWLLPCEGRSCVIGPLRVIMTTSSQSYKQAAYPPGLCHLSDEDIADQLEKSAKRSRAARKAQETIRQKRAEQQAKSEKSA
jgi:hypothetical protein